MERSVSALVKAFLASSASTWPLYECRNLGGMQSSAMARAMKLPSITGASGASRIRSVS